MINDWGSPYLSDFGISAVYDEHTFWLTATTNVKGTMRYMSPELVEGKVKRPTPASDAYAYAMTALVTCPRSDIYSGANSLASANYDWTASILRDPN